MIENDWSNTGTRGHDGGVDGDGENLDDDLTGEDPPERHVVELLPGWVRLRVGHVERVDGLRITTPSPALWDLRRRGPCPFVAEVTRQTPRGPERAQRPLLSQDLVKACEEADARFPVPAWLVQTDDGPPRRLDAEQEDRGWFVAPVEILGTDGLECLEPGPADFGYCVGPNLNPWSASEARHERSRAWRRLQLRRAQREVIR